MSVIQHSLEITSLPPLAEVKRNGWSLVFKWPKHVSRAMEAFLRHSMNELRASRKIVFSQEVDRGSFVIHCTKTVSGESARQRTLDQIEQYVRGLCRTVDDAAVATDGVHRKLPYHREVPALQKLGAKGMLACQQRR